jgi:diguanylate cyclase (GGDEF)-like protein
MPGISGYETLLFLRSREDYVAVIFISANTKIEDIIRGLDAGADDYIRKPFDIREVLSRVRAKLRVKDVQDQLTAANQKLAGLVDIDDLTGLFNMRSIYDRIEREIVRCLRFSRPMALIMMDMDHFKKVNDNHDHLFGSFVISEIGKIIRANIRKVDFGARYGGDEFLVALTETTKDGAMLFCERLRSTIENYDFTSGPDHERLTSSIGVAILDPQAPTDSRTLVRKADEMLYASKENGRNRVTLYDFSIERGHASGIDQTKLRRATET